MKKLLCSLAVWSTVVAVGVIYNDSAAAQILYARYPTLSPDKQTIAFSFRGDIWSVPTGGGKASRLTIHRADDIRPQYSPDGKWLLFSSRRFDNFDIFVMPAQGGPVKQLTNITSDDYGTGWFPGSDSVVFYSERDGRSDIFKVSIDGGTQIKLTGDYREREYDAQISADSKYMIFNTGSGLLRWWRRDLRTAANADIFLQDRTKIPFTSTRLTNHPNHEIRPILNQARGEVYFIANYDNTWAQIYKMPITGGDPVKLTNFKDDGVQWLNSSPDGDFLVFEQGFKIWTLDPSTGYPMEVPITVESDEQINTVERKLLDNPIQWLAISPDDKKITVVIHGEVFVIPAENPVEARRITFSSGREHHVTWGSDSKTLYYCSDRDGDYAIYSADALTGVEKRLTKSTEAEMKPLPSPDGKYLAFYRGTNKIVLLDLATGKEDVWIDGLFHDYAIEETMEFSWSPDSKWLAYTNAGLTYESDIWVKSIDGKTANISKFAGDNSRPRFTSDGKQLYFTGSLFDQRETFVIDLQNKPVEFFESSLDSLFTDSAGKDSVKTKKDKKAIPVVTIDFNQIDKRRNRAYRLESDNTWPVLTPDGKKYYFVASLLGKSEIWSANAKDEAELKQITSSGKAKSQLTISSDGKKLYFLEDGKLKSVSIPDGKAETISVKATMEVDIVANNRQKFNESWRMLKNYFYDPTFRGTDWDATRRKYEPVLEHIRTDLEFSDFMIELMGELRGSHVDLALDESKPSDAIASAAIGIDLDYALIDRSNQFRITHVYAQSPADYAELHEGQFVAAIDGKKLSKETDFESLLSGKVGKRVILAVSDSPGGATHEVDVKPISYSQFENIRYQDWVEKRRGIVDSLSQGRIAYLHIRSMGAAALQLFREQLVSIAGSKDALIVDVRDNPGGSIAVHLLPMLDRTPWLMRSFRDYPTVSENKYRSKAFEGPKACLINGYSGSNAEIFAEGFRRLKLGPIIGTPTGGAVIGTAEYYLLDGTHVRRPSWGAYTVDKEDTDLVPRQPDILVENLPDDLIAGRDPQLVRAVSELLKTLK